MTSNNYVRLVAAAAALGGLLFGYDTGVMSGALLFISPEFDMTPSEEGLVTSMLLVGAAIGALTGGRIADWLGRRRTLLFSGLVFVAGSVWCALVGSMESLAVARTFLGLAVGAVSIVAPMYIAEKSPAAVRGKMVSLNTLMIVIGQLVAYLVNSALAPSGNWQLMLAMAAVPGALLALAMLFLDDTPVWYVRTGQMEKARATASKAGMELEVPDPEPEGQWQALRKNRWLTITVVLAATIGVVQQITGVNAIVYFAPTLMNQVGLSTTNAVYTSIVIGTVSVIACWVGLQIIDRIGRRTLLTVGLIGNVVTLFALSVIYPHEEWAYVSLTVMAVFIAFQQAAVSPTTWLLISEIVPMRIRGIGMGLAGLALWTANWAVAQFFLPLVDTLGAQSTFAVFGVLGIAALGFVRTLVPETKGKTLAQVGGELEARFG